MFTAGQGSLRMPFALQRSISISQMEHDQGLLHLSLPAAAQESSQVRQCQSDPETHHIQYLFFTPYHLGIQLLTHPWQLSSVAKLLLFTVTEGLLLTSTMCRFFPLWDANIFPIAVWLKPPQFTSLSSHRLQTRSLELKDRISSCWIITFSVFQCHYSFANWINILFYTKRNNLQKQSLHTIHLSLNHRNDRLKDLLTYLLHVSTAFLPVVRLQMHVISHFKLMFSSVCLGVRNISQNVEVDAPPKKYYLVFKHYEYDLAS